jgi:hypothetical protein
MILVECTFKMLPILFLQALLDGSSVANIKFWSELPRVRYQTCIVRIFFRMLSNSLNLDKLITLGMWGIPDYAPWFGSHYYVVGSLYRPVSRNRMEILPMRCKFPCLSSGGPKSVWAEIIPRGTSHNRIVLRPTWTESKYWNLTTFLILSYNTPILSSSSSSSIALQFLKYLGRLTYCEVS